MRLLFSADLHGNDGQYERLFGFAAREEVDAVLIGGDIAPKHLPGEGYVAGQLAWYEWLAEHIERFRRIAPNCKVLIMMGNDDVRCNLEPFLSILAGCGALHLHNERHTIGDVDIVGYSCVPLTPFPLKDWELNDTPDDSPDAHWRSAQAVSHEGVLSSPQGWIPTRVPDRVEWGMPTIERDLAQPLFTQDARRTVYVIHAPPAGTKLDLLWNGMHVGSAAVRGFIERRQPLLTLHGHIHETVAVSGDFKERIGDTHSYACGNSEATKEVAVVLVDTRIPGEGERLIL